VLVLGNIHEKIFQTPLN